MNRDKMYACINEKGLNHADTIAASQELDEEIVKDMLKDPVVKCNYLERVIEAKEIRIAKLEANSLTSSNLFDISKSLLNENINNLFFFPSSVYKFFIMSTK